MPAEPVLHGLHTHSLSAEQKELEQCSIPMRYAGTIARRQSSCSRPAINAIRRWFTVPSGRFCRVDDLAFLQSYIAFNLCCT